MIRSRLRSDYGVVNLSFKERSAGDWVPLKVKLCVSDGYGVDSVKRPCGTRFETGTERNSSLQGELE